MDSERQKDFGKWRFGLVHLSLCLHGLIAALLVGGAVYLNGRISQGLSEVRNEVMAAKHSVSGLTKRSTDGPLAPPVHDVLQQKLPGMEALQLVGLVPMIQVNKNGTIGPWRLSGSLVPWASLGPDGVQVTILEAGLYFVYAQVYYLTEESSNSFVITRQKGNSPHPLRLTPNLQPRETLSVCANQAAGRSAAVGASGAAEVSCYTGIVASLTPADRLALYQIEQHRVILFSTGYSHWGIIKLADGDN